jgi:hypothetical protein
MGDLVDPGAGPRWDDGADGVAATPAMPLIRSYEQNLGAPCPLQDGASPTLGWQWRADKKGGRAFGLITRTLSGSDKLREAIPLTQEGWAQAWDVLARLYPDRAAGARACSPSARSPTGPARRPPAENLARLAAMLEAGLLARAEFNTLKANLLRAP